MLFNFSRLPSTPPNTLFQRALLLLWSESLNIFFTLHFFLPSIPHEGVCVRASWLLRKPQLRRISSCGKGPDFVHISVNTIPPNAFWWQLRGVTLQRVCTWAHVSALQVPMGNTNSGKTVLDLFPSICKPCPLSMTNENKKTQILLKG